MREGVDSEDDLEKGAIDDDAEAEELHVHPAAIRGALGPSRFLAGPVAATRTDRSMMGDLGNLVTFGDKRQRLRQRQTGLSDAQKNSNWS